jgi:hypothetical protein
MTFTPAILAARIGTTLGTLTAANDSGIIGGSEVKIFLGRDGIFFLHFFSCAVLFYLMAQSKRLGSNLAPPELRYDYIPAAPRFPDKRLFTKNLLTMKLAMTTAAFHRRTVHRRAYQIEKRCVSVFAPLRCLLEILTAAGWVLFKNTQWLLRKCRLLPSAETGVYVNVIVLWLLTKIYKPLYGLFTSTNVSWLPLAWSDRRVATASGWLHLLFGYISPLLALAVIFLVLAFLQNREVYYDFYGILFLLFIALYRLFGCAAEQCCFGIPWPWGVYNKYLKTIVFPSQYFESAAAFFSVVICVVFMLRAKSYRPGRAAVLAMLLYAPARFAAEFFHYKGDHYRPNLTLNMLGLSAMHWACVAGFVLAGAMWFLLPVEQKLLDAIRAKGKSFGEILKKAVKNNARCKAFRSRVLFNCPGRFQRYYGKDAP